MTMIPLNQHTNIISSVQRVNAAGCNMQCAPSNMQYAQHRDSLLGCSLRKCISRMQPPLKWVKVFRGWIEPQSCTWQTCAIMHSKWCPRRVLTKWCTFSGKLFTSGSVCESRYNKYSSHVFEQNDHCKTQPSSIPSLAEPACLWESEFLGSELELLGPEGIFFNF